MALGAKYLAESCGFSPSTGARVNTMEFEVSSRFRFCLHHSLQSAGNSLPGLPWWLSSKESTCSTGDIRDRFDPWVGKIPWRRAWQQPTPVFVPGESKATVLGVTKSWTQLKRLSTTATASINFISLTCEMGMVSIIWKHYPTMRMDETVHVDTVGTEGIEALVPASYR